MERLMNEQTDWRSALRQKAHSHLARLSLTDRESLLIKNWMAHDARWFALVAKECGMAVTNRINQTAAREVGKVEAQRLGRALQLPPVKTLDDYLVTQETFIGLLGPDLLDYQVSKVSETACQLCVSRCFAYDNVTRAGVAAQYECGIFARVMGWLDALGVAYELSPALGKCLQAQGQECVHTITIR
jgi:hypothetical protein